MTIKWGSGIYKQDGKVVDPGEFKKFEGKDDTGVEWKSKTQTYTITFWMENTGKFGLEVSKPFELKKSR